MIFDSLTAIIAENMSIDESELTANTKFEDIGIDDIDLLDIIMALEEDLGGVNIEVDDDIETLGELVSCIERQM